MEVLALRVDNKTDHDTCFCQFKSFAKWLTIPGIRGRRLAHAGAQITYCQWLCISACEGMQRRVGQTGVKRESLNTVDDALSLRLATSKENPALD